MGGTVTGVIMGAVGTTAVRVGAVEIIAYSTGAVVGWWLAIGFGVIGTIVMPIYGHATYDNDAK